MMNRKSLALGAVFAVGIGLGGVVSADVFGSPAVQAVQAVQAVSATPSAAATPQAPATSTPAASTDETTDDAGGFKSYTDVLAGLVADGTLTQAQADKVVAALEAARPMHDGPGRGGRGPWRQGLDSVATALGLTVDELRTELQSGKTIADIATAKGVDVQTVIDTLVKQVQDRIAQAVTDGKLTQAEADTRLAEVTQRITDVVNGKVPVPGPGGPGGHHRRHGAPDDAATDNPTATPADAPTPTTGS